MSLCSGSLSDQLDGFPNGRRIQVAVVLSCISVAVLMTRAFWLAHRYAKMEALEAKKLAERELAMKAVHFSKRMRWLDTSVVFTGLVWVSVYFVNVWYVCLKCWVGWHCKCKQMAQGASAGLQDLDVHRFCMWSCHASFLCLPVGPLLWITSYHIFSISTLKPRWEAPLNLLLVGTAFAFHVFWLFELTRPGQKNRAAVQEWRCGEHFNDSIPKTIQGAFQVDFIHHVYTYIYIYVCFFFLCVCVYNFILFDCCFFFFTVIQEIGFLLAAILSLSNCARFAALLSLVEFTLPQKHGIFRQMSKTFFRSISNASSEPGYELESVGVFG